MAKSQIAAQLYTLREHMKTPADIAKSLKKVREIGYEAVQVSGIGPIDPEELKEILDKEGLTVCATHIGYDAFKNNLEAEIEKHKLWNCEHMGLGSLPGEYSTSKEGYLTFAKEANEIAKKLADNGLKFIYHNHNHEFIKFDGETGMDILFNNTDPVFDFEIDTYWVQAGGADPVQWIKKMEGRLSVVHFKDMAMAPGRKQIMAEVGEGNLNWPAIIKACKEIGVKWYAVEQDVCQRDPFESLEISFNNLKKMGLE